MMKKKTSPKLESKEDTSGKEQKIDSSWVLNEQLYRTALINLEIRKAEAAERAAAALEESLKLSDDDE